MFVELKLLEQEDELPKNASNSPQLQKPRALDDEEEDDFGCDGGGEQQEEEEEFYY